MQTFNEEKWIVHCRTIAFFNAEICPVFACACRGDRHFRHESLPDSLFSCGTARKCDCAVGDNTAHIGGFHCRIDRRSRAKSKNERFVNSQWSPLRNSEKGVHTRRTPACSRRISLHIKFFPIVEAQAAERQAVCRAAVDGDMPVQREDLPLAAGVDLHGGFVPRDEDFVLKIHLFVVG